MSRRPGEVPRYLEIEGSIRREIEAGDHPVGDDLPTEAQLCEAYNASRFTVREALRRIEAAGYIKRHQGRGSRVTSRWPRETFVLSGPTADDLQRYVAATTVKFRLVPKEMTASLARELGISDPEKWIHYSGIRRTADTGEPVTVFDSYVRREYEIGLNAIDERQERPIFSEIFDQYGLRLSYVDETISATRMPAQIARRLHAEAGEPGLRIVRKFEAEEVGLFEVTVSFNPADRFQYHLRLARGAHRGRTDAMAGDGRTRAGDAP